MDTDKGFLSQSDIRQRTMISIDEAHGMMEQWLLMAFVSALPCLPIIRSRLINEHIERINRDTSNGHVSDLHGICEMISGFAKGLSRMVHENGQRHFYVEEFSYIGMWDPGYEIMSSYLEGSQLGPTIAFFYYRPYGLENSYEGHELAMIWNDEVYCRDWTKIGSVSNGALHALGTDKELEFADFILVICVRRGNT